VTRYALSSAELHAVIATNQEDSTAEAIAKGPRGFQYLRLDYDQQQLGPMFKEPAPHIHVVVDGEPRFAVCRTSADLPVADFVDFIFLNYRHTEWAGWLHGEWFDRYVKEDTDDVFELIDDAFRGMEGGSNLDVLRRPEIREVLGQLRRVLAEEKNGAVSAERRSRAMGRDRSLNGADYRRQKSMPRTAMKRIGMRGASPSGLAA
jgi:hypothetical protein